ncbi:hypothetical protein SK128_004380, partial [Halocaridina rubra]
MRPKANVDYPSHGHLIESLEPAKVYKTEIYCCNKAFCGEILQTNLATKVVPKLHSSINVQSITNSSVVIALPSITGDGDGNSTFAIAVGHLTKNMKSNEELKEWTLQKINKFYSAISALAFYQNSRIQKKPEIETRDQCQSFKRIAGIVQE